MSFEGAIPVESAPSLSPPSGGGSFAGAIPVEETPGLVQRLWKQSLPSTLIAAKENLDKETDARNTFLTVDERSGKSPADEEAERRIKAGDTGKFDKISWATQKGKEMVHGKKAADESFAQQFGTLVDQVKKDPIAFGKQYLEGLLAHPEYFAPGGLAMIPFESAVEQEAKTGYVDPHKVLFDAGMAAVPVMAVHGVVHAGQMRVSALKDAVPTPEVEVKALQNVAAKVEQGAEPLQATDEVLQAMGVPAPESASLVKDARDVIAQHEGKEEPLPTIEQPKEPEHAAEEGKVEEDNQPQHQRTDAPREPETVSQADRGDRVEPSAEVRPKEEAPVDHSAAAIDAIGQARAARFRQLNQKVMGGAKLTEVETKDFDRLHREITQKATALADKTKESTVTPLFKPLPEGLDPKRWVTPEEARTVFKEAGLDEELINSIAGDKPQTIGSIRQRLTKFMGGQRYADNVLADVLVRGGKQSGKADPELLAAMAAVGLGAAGAYALTGDKSKAVGTAMLIGAIAAASLTVRRLGASVESLMNDSKLAKGVNDPFIEYKMRPQMVDTALDNWYRSADKLLTEPIGWNPFGWKDRAVRKEASKTKVRDWLQGYRDMGDLNLLEKEYANRVRDLLDHTGNQAMDAGKLDRMREDYLTGLWRKKPFQNIQDILRELKTDEAFRGNWTGMSRNSRFNLQKVIPDYRVAERLNKEGKFSLVAVTNDPAKMAVHYVRSMQKTLAVDKLIKDFKQVPTNRFYEKTGIPVPVIISMNLDEATGRIVKANEAMMGRAGANPVTVDAWNKMSLMDAKSDYVPVRHPSLNGLLVHKDVAPALKMFFDTSDPSKAMKLLYGASMASKALFFTTSTFHLGSLAVVFANTAISLPGRVGMIVGTPRYWRSLPEARQMMRNSAYAPNVEMWSKGGLTFKHTVPEDFDPNIVSRILSYGADTPVVGLPLKALRFANDTLVHFLWGEAWPTLKLSMAHAELQSWWKKHPDADRSQFEKAVHEIAMGVNTLEGGQDWFSLANDIPEGMSRRMAMTLLSPKSRRAMQIGWLSPDWNVSAIRAWTEGFKSILPGLPAKASDSMYRNYLLWSSLTYLAIADILAKHYTGHHIWDQKDWTYVDRGDGTKIQLNKHHMEFAHLVMNPMEFFLSKMNLIPKEILDQVFGKEYVSWNNEKGEFSGPPMTHYSYGMTRPMHALKTFIPLTIANIIKDPATGLESMFWTPIYGMPYSKREELAVERAEQKGEDPEKALARQKKLDETSEKKLYKDYVPPPKKRKLNPDADIVQ